MRDLVTSESSAAATASEKPFEEVPFHLTYKCDGCMFNEFCMKWSAEHDDLSILPHLTVEDKSALQGTGIGTVRELAALKEIRVPGPTITHNLARAARWACCRRIALTPQGGKVSDCHEHSASNAHSNGLGSNLQDSRPCFCTQVNEKDGQSIRLFANLIDWGGARQQQHEIRVLHAQDIVLLTINHITIPVASG